MHFLKDKIYKYYYEDYIRTIFNTKGFWVYLKVWLYEKFGSIKKNKYRYQKMFTCSVGPTNINFYTCIFVRQNGLFGDIPFLLFLYVRCVSQQTSSSLKRYRRKQEEGDASRRFRVSLDLNRKLCSVSKT